MSSRIGAFMLLILLCFQFLSVSALTNGFDASALQALKADWTKYPESWVGADPCGTNWVGITCTNDRVVSISLGNLDVEGKLSSDIASLTELQILDLSYNTGLTGPLPSNIGAPRLKARQCKAQHPSCSIDEEAMLFHKSARSVTLHTASHLTPHTARTTLKRVISRNHDFRTTDNGNMHRILVACSFSGQIPESIGDLEQLIYLSLNLNQFSGRIPASIGRLSDLYWFDIADNQIEGTLPVSNGTSSPGLDMLLETKHFHFGKNKLSGVIPETLFSSKMTLIHVLFDGNNLTGDIPDTLSLVKTLTVLRLDRNKLTGNIPTSLNNLTNLQELYLANNEFTGSLPNLTSLTSLYTLDVSNNTLEFSPIPSWISSLRSLATFILKRNRINSALDFGTSYSNQLEFVDLQYNDIDVYTQPSSNTRIQVILADNPVCQEMGNSPSYCTAIPHNTSYSTIPTTCSPCDHDREASPLCRCAHPFTGTFNFRAPSFSGLFNSTNFEILQKDITGFFNKFSYPVDSVAVRNIRDNTTDHQLLIDLLVFPLGRESFNETGMLLVNFAFSNQTYKPPPIFGPYIFIADPYTQFSDGGGSKSSNMGVIIGAAVGGVVLLLLLTLAGVYALRQRKRADRATDQNNPFAKWSTSKSSIDAPQLMGAKSFTFEELKKCTDNFSEANDVGGGGYGKVYRGILPSGQLIAIKRAQQGSLQGGLEFKTEIELLSRVHHKNVVRLLGFCFDRSEQMLVYEYIPNGSLRDSLSGSGDPYGKDSFQYSGNFPASKLEPQ
ncbi:hypothetical protein DY000_02015549 [Brassica cretica]|uniref:non-specific serine/threonine protein kinase n=1 Tax=Brassica cretica TaxID=69181 RepID=A0ABQ7CQH5_BRACR|nr:hypothetical protein DY000_02015549 [Brassica cretica]